MGTKRLGVAVFHRKKVKLYLILSFQARSPAEMNFSLDTNKAQRELISQLELKNR